MPVYNVKQRFADDVEQGSKLNTIRPQRKRPTKVGDTLYLYTGMRTRKCRLLRKTTCIGVLPVEILHGHVIVDGLPLSREEIDRLAQSDGFASSTEFFDFFVETYGLCQEKPLTEMELIKWEPLAPLRQKSRNTAAV